MTYCEITIVGWVFFGVTVALMLPPAVSLLVRPLPRMASRLRELGDAPLVSVIIAARDEGEFIEAALAAHLAADYPNLEIIAVDDRSQDGTGAVMDRLAAAEPRLHVTHIAELPEGWLGKNHAMQVGADAARGEMLLFCDGDVILAPDAIRLAVRYTVRNNLDHLCLLPVLAPGGYWENALMSHFGLMFITGTFFWLARTPLRFAYVGVGAFNLVRKQAYETVGGHQPIRFDVLDDVKLGKLLKRSGYRQELLASGGLVRVKWQQSVMGFIRGLEKNGFAGADYSLAKLACMSISIGVLTFAPYGAVALLRDQRMYGFAASLVLSHLVYGMLGHAFGSGWRVLPVLPVAALGTLYAFWRSAFVTLRQGGVSWRDTFYPLADLRKRLYR